MAPTGTVEVITGGMNDSNTLTALDTVTPQLYPISVESSQELVYEAPANSVSFLKMPIQEETTVPTSGTDAAL